MTDTRNGYGPVLAGVLLLGVIAVLIVAAVIRSNHQHATECDAYQQAQQIAEANGLDNPLSNPGC